MDPSPPIRAVLSSIRSKGNGGSHNGFIAIDISFMGLSSELNLIIHFRYDIDFFALFSIIY